MLLALVSFTLGLLQVAVTVGDEIRTVEQCYGQPLPLSCEPGLMVQVTKAIYRQTKNCGNFHSAFCSQEEAGNPACVGNTTCIFNTPYVYLSPECGYSNNFLVKYKCISAANQIDMCSTKTLTNLTGFIISPSYPLRYPTGKTCNLKITLPAGYIINMYTLDLYLAYYRVNHQTDKQCIDNLIIHDGHTKSESLCSGKQRSLVFTSTTNWVLLNFTSDWHQYRNSKGFWLYYEAIHVGTNATPASTTAVPTVSSTMAFKTLKTKDFTPYPLIYVQPSKKPQIKSKPKSINPTPTAKPPPHIAPTNDASQPKSNDKNVQISKPTMVPWIQTLTDKVDGSSYSRYLKSSISTQAPLQPTTIPTLYIPKPKNTVQPQNYSGTDNMPLPYDIQTNATAVPGQTLPQDGSYKIKKQVEEEKHSEIGGIIAGTSVCVGIVLLVIATAVLCNRRVNSKRISKKEKGGQLNDIIMAYGPHDQLIVPSTPARPKPALLESPRATSLPPPSPVAHAVEEQQPLPHQEDEQSEPASPWPMLRPIDERPELLYTQVKKRSEENLKMMNQLRGKHNPRKAKSLDDINSHLKPQRSTKRDRLQHKNPTKEPRELGSITLSMSLDSIDSDQESDSPVFNTDTRTGTLTRALYETLEDLYTESILARARSDYEAVQQGRLFAGDKTGKKRPRLPEEYEQVQLTEDTYHL